VLNKIIPDISLDLRVAGEVCGCMGRMGLGGQEPLGEVKTKDESPVAARQAEVARDYLKRAAGIGELSGHPPGSDGPVLIALR
jgi:hypothetical protein